MDHMSKLCALSKLSWLYFYVSTSL